MTSIYASTISSENFIIINNKTIELSGNIFMKKDVTINNGLLTTNSLIPNVTNSASLGSTSNSWSNAYISDLSVNNNLQVTGNVKISKNLDVSNIYTKSQVDASLVNVYTKAQIDASFVNVYTRGEIDLSFANVYTKSQVDLSFANVYTKASSDASFANVYTKAYVDASFSNVYTKALIDASFANVYTKNQVDASLANVYTKRQVDASFSNVYTKIQVDASFSNVYTKNQVDVSFSNVYTKSQIDLSFSNVYTKSQIDASFLNVYTKNQVDVSLANVYTKNVVDVSFANVYTKAYVDASFSNVYTKAFIDASFNNVYIKSRVDASFSNVYNKSQIDLSFSNVYTKGQVDTSFLNVYTRNQLDVSFVSKQIYEASFNALAAGGGGGSVNLTSITSNVVPSTTNTYTLGSTTKYWSNAYIRDLRVSNRAYQEISGDISWSAVNGHYGLSKDAYPSLNPLSSGVKAVITWTQRTTGLYDSTGICWSPELKRFVAVTYDTVYTSTDGINWSSVTAITGYWWCSVCWSPQLKIFVAVSNTDGGVMTSLNGINWSLTIVTNYQWLSVCWSPELGLFVAVSLNTSGGRLMTSRNGTSWSQYHVGDYTLRSVCWSAELGIFVIITHNSFVFTSKNGIDWFISSIPSSNAWECVCWSPQLGIFLAIAYHGAKLMTSSNGINWIERAISTPVPAAPTFPNIGWMGVCWCAEIGLFVAVGQTGSPRVMTSHNGIDWISRTSPSTGFNSVCWSPELGLVVASGSTFLMTSSLKGRPPTSYNVFDSSFNSIDETGKWTFTNVATTTLTVNTTNYPSDDRLKHNEVVINNGLTIMDRLNPKFYQKTLAMLDASYNGDLSNHAWNYEAGLIAQEVLQIPDLSFAVSGGDYYLESYNYYDTSANDLSSNDLSANDLNDNDISDNDTSANITSLNYYNRNNNYDISYKLVTQAYALNYNNIFVYGLAAIKELHQKVKAQEATMLEQQTIINSLSARMEALENFNQD